MDYYAQVSALKKWLGMIHWSSSRSKCVGGYIPHPPGVSTHASYEKMSREDEIQLLGYRHPEINYLRGSQQVGWNF